MPTTKTTLETNEQPTVKELVSQDTTHLDESGVERNPDGTITITRTVNN